MTCNDQYPSRQETEKGYQAAESIGLDFDSHTLKPLAAEFIKLKRPVARYDVTTKEMVVLRKDINIHPLIMVDEANAVDGATLGSDGGWGG